MATMLPMTFETFVEQGASKIDASVRELQRTYDEVVWGIESPPPYVDKKKQAQAPTSSSSGKKKVTRKHGRQNNNNKKKPRSRVRFNRQRARNDVQTTPSTVTDVDSLFNDDDDDSSGMSDQGSTTSLTSSASESEIATLTRRTARYGANNNNGFISQPQHRYQTPSDNSILATHQPTTKAAAGSSDNNSILASHQPTKPPTKIHGRPRRKIAASPPSIDEIFGYNTRQTISRRKAFADQDVGLDFCLLDAPTGSGRSRSLLIVQGIDPKGLFADTDLGVGDAVLAINGVNIREEEPSPLGLHGNQRSRSYESNNPSSSPSSSPSFNKPNLFKARALLNGRGLIVRIDYQKFGETNSSIAPSLEGTTMGAKYHNVKGLASGPAITTAAAALSRDYPLIREEPSVPRNSVYRSRRKSSGPASTRVDFLGALRSTDPSATTMTSYTATIGRSSSEEEEEEEEEDPTLLPSIENNVLNTKVNISADSSATTKSNNTTNTKEQQASPSDEAKSETELEAPPKISRLTRLKARTQKLRSNRKNKTNGGKNHNKNNKNNNNSKIRSTGADDKENDPNVAAVEPVETVPAIKHESETTELDTSAASAALPYRSLLSNSNGPEEQMRLLKERVRSSGSSSSLPGKNGTTATTSNGGGASPRSIRSVDNGCDGGGGDSNSAFCSPARSTLSTHSESYLSKLRKGLSSTANAILDDLSFGEAPKSGCVGSTDADAAVGLDDRQEEMMRVNRRFYHKLQIRIDCLQQSNARLTDELSAMRRGEDHKKLEEVRRQLDQAEAKEKVYESELGLYKSRLDIANIQADKRHRELTESKEQLVAENDKVIANLTKRIEQLEGANRRLLEQLQKVDTKRQEKYSSLQAQFERLKMKFSAQSTLLDNVMTANEELTSRNKDLESELHESVKPHVPDPVSPTPTSPTGGMFLVEASEYDTEHIKRDPILLAQAKELSSLREENANLEDKVDSLTLRLSDLEEFQRSAAQEPAVALPPVKEVRSDGAPSGNDSTGASDANRSLIDNAFSSSGEEESDTSNHHRGKSTQTRPPLPRRKKATSPSSRHNPNNVSIENPSDESTGFNVSLVEIPTDEDSAFNTGGVGCWRPGSPNNHQSGFYSSDGPATTFKLKYRHEYEDLARLDVGNDDVVDDNERKVNKEAMNHQQNHGPNRSTKPVRSPSTVDESFESTSSLALMERILELETALQGAPDLNPDETQKFVTSLQSRMAKLNEKGYSRVGTVEVLSTEEGDVSVEVTEV